MRRIVHTRIRTGYSMRERRYFGATPKRPVGTTFSFFPCQPYDERGHGFARPEVRIPGYVTPQLNQGKKIARDLTLTQLGELWQEVVQQVLEQQLALGVYAKLPPKRKEEQAPQESARFRTRC